MLTGVVHFWCRSGWERPFVFYETAKVVDCKVLQPVLKEKVVEKKKAGTWLTYTCFLVAGRLHPGDENKWYGRLRRLMFKHYFLYKWTQDVPLVSFPTASELFLFLSAKVATNLKSAIAAWSRAFVAVFVVAASAA